MKTNKLTFLTILGLLFINFLIQSCSTENDEQISKELIYKESTLSSGKVYFTYSNPNSRGGEQERHSLELQFDSNVELPSNEVELESFLNENAEYIDGVFKLSVDNKVVYETFVENGIEVSSIATSGSWADPGNPGDYPCNFNGLSHCTQDSIDEMSFFAKALCIAAGFACVAEQFADCAWIHCGGEGWAQDNGIN